MKIILLPEKSANFHRFMKITQLLPSAKPHQVPPNENIPSSPTDEVLRDGNTLMVRFPANPDVELDLRPDVLRVSQGGTYRDIALGCRVDVSQCRAKKRHGYIEVRLTVTWRSSHEVGLSVT